MKKTLISVRIFLLVLILICTSAAFSEEKTKPDFSEAIRLIDTWLEAQRDYDHLPGISVAIVMDQEILWSKAYGMADREKKVSSSPSTIYSICSISKLFTSVAIMKLRDAGKLRLEDLIADHLPWQGKLAIFGLPSENPAEGLTLLKHIEGDTFRRVRKDETLGEEVKFERDKTGKVVRMWQHSNYENKIR